MEQLPGAELVHVARCDPCGAPATSARHLPAKCELRARTHIGAAFGGEAGFEAPREAQIFGVKSWESSSGHASQSRVCPAMLHSKRTRSKRLAGCEGPEDNIERARVQPEAKMSQTMQESHKSLQAFRKAAQIQGNGVGKTPVRPEANIGRPIQESHHELRGKTSASDHGRFTNALTVGSPRGSV